MKALEKLNEMSEHQGIDADQYRRALGLYASGITVISAHDGKEPLGFTCQSFHSVSINPRLILFSVMTTSTTYPRIREIGNFSVNVLSEGQQWISTNFARSGVDKWADVDWAGLSSGTPAISGALLSLDCTILAEHVAGDHFVVIGHVKTMQMNVEQDGKPLLYYRGKYRQLDALNGLA